MAIRLLVEATDPEVEGLLAYLQTQNHPTTTRRIGVLERAIEWLRASDPASFRCDPTLPHSGRLTVEPSPGSLSVLSEDTLPLHRA